MGLSSTSALIGLGMVIIGLILRLTRKQGRLAAFLLMAGIVLIVVPYALIYFLLD